MVTRFGERPRPWVLVHGLDDSDASTEVRAAVEQLEHASVDVLDSLYGIDLGEYDTAVLFETTANLPASLDVVQFGGSSCPDSYRKEDRRWAWRPVSSGTAQRSHIPEGTLTEIERLAAATLVPWLQAAPRPYPVVKSMGYHPMYPGNGSDVEVDGFEGFLVSGGEPGPAERAVAGRYRRSHVSGAQAWYLPSDVSRPGDWVRLAISMFAESRPPRYPGRAVDWVSDPQWMAPAEVEATTELEGLADRRRIVLEDLDRRSAEATATLEQRRAEAGAGHRRLLTHQGDDLVDEVEATLTTLGFTCLRPDAERAATRDALLEDLEVRDGDWNTLVEVRGYAKGGGKTADFQRIARFVTHYVKRTGDEPSATWYVVNHSFSDPPPERRRVLGGGDDDVAIFAEGGGLVVDTRDLFRLRVAVENGTLSAEEARTLLKTTTGILDYPGPESAA